MVSKLTVQGWWMVKEWTDELPERVMGRLSTFGALLKLEWMGGKKSDRLWWSTTNEQGNAAAGRSSVCNLCLLDVMPKGRKAAAGFCH